MNSFPRPEHQSDENESHKKPTWPWEKAPEDKETKKKLDNQDEKETKKKVEQSKKEKEAKKEEKPENPAQEPDEEKRERRATLVEQSIALVAKYEEEQIPRDASALARLMIAHQVIHLNNQLDHPDSEHAPEKIEATLDFIAHLDEKFKNPDTKAEPAIEQSYQEIMEVAEATLEGEPDLEKVVAEIGGQKTPNSSEASGGEPSTHLSTEEMSPSRASRAPWDGSQPPIKRPEGGDGERTANKTTSLRSDTNKQKDPDQEELDRRRYATEETIPAVATAAGLIYLITHLGHKKPNRETGSNYSPASPDQSFSINPQRFAQQNNAPGEQPPAPTSQLPFATPFRSERPPTPGRERVTVLDRRRSPALATTAVATAFATNRARGKVPRTATTSPETHHFPGEPAKPEFSAPPGSSSAQRKIEHMPLLQLLSMAETVDLGNGRYLRREFESGHIDKEGLVKTLKAHSKGRDYQFEFHQQAGRFAKLKETSPEFLHQTKPAKAGVANDESLEEKQFVSIGPKSEVDKKATPNSRPFSLAPPTKYNLLPELASGIHQPKHTGRRLALITIATLTGLALIGWLAITIFNALN